MRAESFRGQPCDATGNLKTNYDDAPVGRFLSVQIAYTLKLHSGSFNRSTESEHLRGYSKAHLSLAATLGSNIPRFYSAGQRRLAGSALDAPLCDTGVFHYE